MAGQPKQQKRTPVPQWDNPLEAIKSLGSDVTQSFSDDLVKGIASNIFEEFGLRPSQKLSGELSPSETLNLSELKKRKEPEKQPAPAIEQLVRAENIVLVQEGQAVAQKIQEIQWELKKLIASSNELQVQFKEVLVESTPVNPGVYHLNFFEWILSLVKSLRAKVEDASVWLHAFQSKKAKRGGYWGMFKKHGTSFGLSGERVVATQTG